MVVPSHSPLESVIPAQAGIQQTGPRGWIPPAQRRLGSKTLLGDDRLAIDEAMRDSMNVGENAAVGGNTFKDSPAKSVANCSR
jgi:hypothetical protein